MPLCINLSGDIEERFSHLVLKYFLGSVLLANVTFGRLKFLYINNKVTASFNFTIVYISNYFILKNNCAMPKP